MEAPRIAEKNDFFDVEIIRPVVTGSERLRPITNEEQPELQPEFEKLQPEFKAWIDSWLEEEQQELQQEFNDGQPELQPESLYSEIVLRLAENNLSKQGLADALGHKSISGQLKVVINQLIEDQLIEWTIPEKPKSSKQKYKLTKKGLAFYIMTRKKGRDQ